MAATTTPSINSILPRLRDSYPELSFEPAERCTWNPQTQTITYDDSRGGIWQLFHELGHAKLHHHHYRRDIELIGFERDAWQTAKQVADTFDLTIPASEIEDHLDSYRDWLHARSTCVNCRQTGLQSADHEYSCPHCQTVWRVNDARTCGLRRYRVE